MEFHISRAIRERLDLDDLLFSFTGNVVFANVVASRKLAQRLSALQRADSTPTPDPAQPDPINAGALFAMGLIDELSHALIARYRKEVDPAVLSEALRWFSAQTTPAEVDRLLLAFTREFPNIAIFRGELTPEQWLAGTTEGLPNREAAFEEMLLLWLANSNPAFTPFHLLFDDAPLARQTAYPSVTAALPAFFAHRPPVAAGLGSLLDLLRAPMLAAPDSLTGQLEIIREQWEPILGAELSRVLLAIDTLREEEVALWMRFHPATPGHFRDPSQAFAAQGFRGDQFIGFEGDDEEFITGPDGVRIRRYAAGYQAPLNEYEAFSADQAWMPTVVLIAKNTYVWLEQLSKQYGRHIHRLDQIPDEELRLLADRGMTGLWLIGLWERSKASRTIKNLCGNPDAVASAYSLKDYSIAEDLGGEAACHYLRERAAAAGLRLASDMVPNHMGIDSTWVIDHPEWFLARSESPFPSYSFEGPDLSTDSRVEIKLEEHYYNQSDAAVVFRLRHHRDASTRFMYHGNDGTTFAWNDTAQLDYSKASVREHVIQVILDVARRFPIIRFDAAMVLAKRHVQRLWFPLPGAGGSIPSRAEDALSDEAFNALMPHEFWREVVDRVAVEVPGTLLLAEAFWLLEGYFVRTLGMHRVYNSAFMNMLRDEENAKYRSYLKKTVEFDPDILKRYVNFMSNPDEKTALDQFGTGDKFFGVSVLLATLPGLPMFGHGQVEGLTERYGMDFKQARLDESPNAGLVAHHQHLIAPLLKNRQLFAESTHFVFYDFWTGSGTVDENVFAYSNRHGHDRAIVFYNNAYNSTHGTIHMSVGFLEKAHGALQQRSLAEGLALPDGSSIIAYRDHVSGLEHLRSAHDLRSHGLTLPLHGYQHVVLLHWRVLQPSAEHPWDRLCDALHGAGVYSVDEALSQLRLRPLHEALRQTLTPGHLHHLANLATEAAKLHSPTGKAVIRPRPKLIRNPLRVAAAAPLPADPRLQGFTDAIHHLTHQVLAFAASSSVDPSITPASSSVAAALRLPGQIATLAEPSKSLAARVLPHAGFDSEQAWAPVLAWIALQSAPGLTPETFDQLQLRSALAEAFSSIGIKGEAAWRAAARIRLLLQLRLTGSDAPHTEAFWADPDVRWLAGIHDAFGSTYLSQEHFEDLLSWLHLPVLLSPAQPSPSALKIFTACAAAAKQASYNLQPFLDLLTPAVMTPAPAPLVVETAPVSSR